MNIPQRLANCLLAVLGVVAVWFLIPSWRVGAIVVGIWAILGEFAGARKDRATAEKNRRELLRQHREEQREEEKQAQATAPPAPPPTEAAPPRSGALPKIERVTVTPRTFNTVHVEPQDLDQLPKLGNGGEAVVYKRDEDSAWKIFRTPDDEFYEGDDPSQQNARETAAQRLRDYGKKFSQFPLWLGSRFVGPTRMLSTDTHTIGGYEMPLVRDSVRLSKYREPKWKEDNNVDEVVIGRVFLDLYDTVRELHACGVVIGDFKPANVLVTGYKAYIVDAEAAQFGSFPCLTFSDGYIDPRLCDPKLDHELRVKPYDRAADWYAFMVMLFESLRNIHPFAGAYMPKGKGATVKPGERALRGISIYHRDVTLPGYVVEGRMPERLRAAFRDLFEHGIREIPKREWIAELAGVKTADTFQPTKHTCWKAYPVQMGTVVEGPVGIATSEFPIQGSDVVAMGAVGGKPAALIRRRDNLCREDGSPVIGSVSTDFNHFTLGDQVLLMGTDRENGAQSTYDGPFYLVPDVGQALKIPEVDCSPSGTPNIGLQGREAVWLHHGMVRRTDSEEEFAVIDGSLTLFTGESFALILSMREGEYAGLYLLKEKTVVELVGLPPLIGRITGTEAHFSAEAAWLFIDVEWNGATTRFTIVINASGRLIALGHGGSWCAAKHKAAFDTKNGKYSAHHIVVAEGDTLLQLSCDSLAIQATVCHRGALRADMLGMRVVGETLVVAYPAPDSPTDSTVGHSDQAAVDGSEQGAAESGSNVGQMEDATTQSP